MEASPPEEKPRSGSWMTRPISETLTGHSAGSAYDSAVKSLLPESMQREKGAGWMARFTTEIARSGPEMLDFVQSPLGASLVAAHMFPATAPFAAIVDVGLGGMGMLQSIPQIKKAVSDGEPESWAEAVKGIAFSIGMVKGGAKTSIAKTMQFRAEPLESREALRNEIRSTPAVDISLDRIEAKLKTVPRSEINEWSKKPLSEIETAHRKASESLKVLRTKLTQEAAADKRPISFQDKQRIRAEAKTVRMLSDIRGATLPEKIRAQRDAGEVNDPSFAQRVSKRVYDNPWLREPAKMVNIPKPRLMQVSADIVFDRAAFLAKNNMEVNRLIYDLKKSVPLEDRTIKKMGYVMQGSATADEVGLSAQGRAALPKIREWVKNQGDMLYEAYGKDLPLQDAETYLTQVWDLSKTDQAGRRTAARTLMNDPFLKKKTIDSYKTGIEKLGFTPKHDDVLDLLKLRHDFASKAIANRRMASWLRDLGVIISEPEFHSLGPGRKGIGSVGSEWKPATDAVALYRAAYSSKPMDPGAVRAPVYVHPDYADAVNAVYGKGFEHPAFAAAETLRALGKKTALTFSMFHHWALSEQAQAIYATRKNPATTLGKTFFFNPTFWRGVKSGAWEAIGREGEAPPAMRVDPKISTDAVEHGLNLNSEEQEHWVYKKLQDLSTSQNSIAKAVGMTVKPVATALKGWDKALWDFYHQGMMLDSYEMLKAHELSKIGHGASDAKVREVKRSIAEHVNNAFGSVSYEKMLLSPKVRQSLNWLLLAPAWTLSNIRVLTSGYETEAGVRLTNRYVAGAAASWFLSTQAMNMGLSAWYTRNDPDGPKPRLTYDNPGLPMTVAGHPVHGLTENSLNIYAGKNDDGSERYIVFGKGFREPFGWVSDPMNTFFGKLSLPVRGALVQATGHAPGSGFEEIDSRASTSEQMAQRASAGLESVGVPFGAQSLVKSGMHALSPRAVPAPQSSSQFASLPTRKGASFMRVEKAYAEAIDAGDMDRARDVLLVGAVNGVDPKKIQQSYKQDERKKQRRAAQ